LAERRNHAARACTSCGAPVYVPFHKFCDECATHQREWGRSSGSDAPPRRKNAPDEQRKGLPRLDPKLHPLQRSRQRKAAPPKFCSRCRENLAVPGSPICKVCTLDAKRRRAVKKADNITASSSGSDKRSKKKQKREILPERPQKTRESDRPGSGYFAIRSHRNRQSKLCVTCGLSHAYQQTCRSCGSPVHRSAKCAPPPFYDTCLNCSKGRKERVEVNQKNSPQKKTKATALGAASTPGAPFGVPPAPPRRTSRSFCGRLYFRTRGGE
jgi:hypothetical protein